jgi:hypothetical protein
MTEKVVVGWTVIDKNASVEENCRELKWRYRYYHRSSNTWEFERELLPSREAADAALAEQRRSYAVRGARVARVVRRVKKPAPLPEAEKTTFDRVMAKQNFPSSSDLGVSYTDRLVCHLCGEFDEQLARVIATLSGEVKDLRYDLEEFKAGIATAAAGK